MDTKEFNEIRSFNYIKKLTEDESRLWLMIGMTEDKRQTFVADESLTPLSIAEKLEGIASAIRGKYTNVS